MLLQELSFPEQAEETDEGTEEGSADGGTVGEGTSPRFSTEDEIALGFLRFGLKAEAYAFLRRERERLTASGLYSAAVELAAQGDIRQAITVTNMILNKNGGAWDSGLRNISYPRAYVNEIMSRADENGIPWYLLSSLVREESYFDANAVSHAGAVGLSQLMPATAREVSRRMGLEDVDLNDPSTNLAVGANFFGQMLRRFDEIPLYAVGAYNAGPNRIVRWRDGFSYLPPDLVVEAFPFKETRNHGKKVLVSALVYGAVYDRKNPEDILSEYFTGLNRGQR
jgi:soluble lytic murein transglycosylase